MKTLIAYSTKHGATKIIAERIADIIGEATLLDLKGNTEVSISDYDCIVLGSPLMAGSIRKDVDTFIDKKGEELQNKKIGLFVSGLLASEEEDYFKKNFSQEMLDRAVVKAFLGGIFDPKKSGFVERKIIKAVAKMETYTNNIDEEKIKVFAQKLVE